MGDGNSPPTASLSWRTGGEVGQGSYPRWFLAEFGISVVSGGDAILGPALARPFE